MFHMHLVLDIAVLREMPRSLNSLPCLPTSSAFQESITNTQTGASTAKRP